MIKSTVRIPVLLLLLVLMFSTSENSNTVWAQASSTQHQSTEEAGPPKNQEEPLAEVAQPVIGQPQTAQPLTGKPPAENQNAVQPKAAKPKTVQPAAAQPAAAQPAKPAEPKGWWAETMKIPEARWIIWIFTVVTLVLLGTYFAKNFREMAFGRTSEMGNSDFMTEFGKLRDQGALDDDEYAKLKQTLVQSETRTKNQTDTNPLTTKTNPNSSSVPNSESATSPKPMFEADHDEEDND